MKSARFWTALPQTKRHHFGSLGLVGWLRHFENVLGILKIAFQRDFALVLDRLCCHQLGLGMTNLGLQGGGECIAPSVFMMACPKTRRQGNNLLFMVLVFCRAMFF
jgi:hypothetical protein